MPVNPEDMIQLLIKTNAELEERLKEKDQTICDLRTTVERALGVRHNKIFINRQIRIYK